MNISIERLEQIENERVNTFMDPAFREWSKSLNVSRMCVGREGVDRANHMMDQWQEKKDYSIFKSIVKYIN